MLLILPTYPYQEFSAIQVNLDFTANISTDSSYIAKVILPTVLQTNYKRTLQYHEGMQGQGEIITADTI